MTLPLLLSVPHAGLSVPPEVADLNLLTEEQIARDGDEGAAVIYDLEEAVAEYVSTPVARAFLDMNRAVDDRRMDGVVKTHTCWGEPIYREPLGEDRVARLLAAYYTPYHRALTRLAGRIRLGVDGHTMAAFGPPVGPDTGRERPALCLSNGDGTCPESWLRRLADRLAGTFGLPVNLNDPFRGGYIIRAHGAEMPWIQIEISRAPFLPAEEKRGRLVEGLTAWCRDQGW